MRAKVEPSRWMKLPVSGSSSPLYVTCRRQHAHEWAEDPLIKSGRSSVSLGHAFGKSRRTR